MNVSGRNGSSTVVLAMFLNEFLLFYDALLFVWEVDEAKRVSLDRTWRLLLAGNFHLNFIRNEKTSV